MREIPCLTIEYSTNNKGARRRAAEPWKGGLPSPSKEMVRLIYRDLRIHR